MNLASYRVGIDIGGTFTDFVVYEPASGRLTTYKLPSTPDDPARAVLAGLASLSGQRQIVHGSTIATNALLEHKGARSALITTRGFRDVLQIGRQQRPALYDLMADPPAPLVDRALRLEVDERVTADGLVEIALNPTQVDAYIPLLQQMGVISVAVSLLFSFLHPQHEQLIADRLRRAGFFVSASHEILPAFREFERTSTTVANAYLSPIMNRYIANLEQALSPGHTGLTERSSELRIMQSNGGSISTTEARRNGVRCVVSGPAGGVVGALRVARLALQQESSVNQPVNIITFDMGGTSTDVSLCDGDIRTTSEADIGGYPIHIPIIDIHTVGAGGGSIASVDAGGALRVGPQSAGAEPGPACYGHGDLATVTDANIVLGRLPARYFMGGRIHINESRSFHAMSVLGQALNIDARAAARGVIDIANIHMEHALRVISVERGHDPRDFTLVSFGGAGGLHAVELARRLSIRQVLISPLAATLSAFGMLSADAVKDYVQTVMLPGDTPEQTLNERFRPLLQQGLADLAAEGFDRVSGEIDLELSLDMRYQGQSYELSVPYSQEYRTAFHRAHEGAYGYSRSDAPVEIVNLRVRAIGHLEPPPLEKLPDGDLNPARALLEYNRIVLRLEEPVPFYRAELLQPGDVIAGPAIVIRDDTTILLDHADQAYVDRYMNLLVRVEPLSDSQ